MSESNEVVTEPTLEQRTRREQVRRIPVHRHDIDRLGSHCRLREPGPDLPGP